LIVPLGQHEIEGQLPDPGLNTANLAGNLFNRLGIILFKCKIEKYPAFFQIGLDRPEPFDLVRKQGPFFQNIPGLFGIVPESLSGDKDFDFR
jgi:hypothetical protein